MKGWTAVLAVLAILGASQYLPAADSAPQGTAAEPAPQAVQPSPQAAEPPPQAAEPAPQAAQPPPQAAEPAPQAAQPSPQAAEAQAYPDGLVISVEKGATLWDLAAKYLGSPWRWQELWERNRFLTNPHYIYPGVKIVIFPPPAKEYTMTTAAPPPAVSPEAPAEAASAPAPAPEVKAPPEPPKKPTLAISPAEFVRGGEFVRRRPTGIGAIRAGDEPKVSFSEGDKVILSLDKPIPEGQLLGVYRVRGPISGPSGGGVSGYVRYLAGILQVTGVKESQPTAVVRASFEDLLRTDLLSEEIPAYAPVVIEAGADGLRASIITGRLQNTELSTGDFVYLDKGESAGVAAGNVFRISRRGEASVAGYADAGGSTVSLEVGKVVVIRTSAAFSTAYVSDCTQSFQAGATAHRGGAGPR